MNEFDRPPSLAVVRAIQRAEREKVLDEVIATWREWHSEGIERPIQRETVVKVFEQLRKREEK